MTKLRALALCAAVSLLGASQASAAVTYTFDLSGLPVNGGFGDNFPTLIHDFGIAGSVTSIEFDVAYEALPPSWQSEVVISLDTDSAFIDIFMIDYGAPDAPGVFAVADAFPIVLPSGDGLVYLTLWDFFDDGIDPDDIFLSGSYVTVHYEPIPEPASIALVGLGLAGVVGYRLRRRKVS